MKTNQKLSWAWVGVMVLILIAVSLFMQPTQVQASKALQATATFTATAAATNTPTPTATPIATQLPMVSGAQGLYNGVRVGNYAVPTPSTNGSAFQSTVGSIDLYSATGRHTVNIDNATGNATFYGSVTSQTGINWKCVQVNITGSVTATPIAGATPVGNPLVSLAAVTANGSNAYAVYSAGTFTVGVANASGTPATTPVATEYCYIYTTQ